MTRLFSLGIDPHSIDAILISHEHADHICGVPALSRKLKIPVYANKETAKFIDRPFGLEIIGTGQEFIIGTASIRSFGVVHDAVDPVGFTIESDGMKFAQATDLGKVTTVVKEALSGVNALVLESNHDLGMLHSSDYPWQLKQRISSSHGHLSNDVAGRLLREISHPDLGPVVLGHLSENCNTPEIALRTVTRYVEEVLAPKNIICGCVARPTPLFELGGSSALEAVGG